jgi:ABC-type transport system involved in cytochrome bd biosynthesis fused ATPase/permease subunit
MYLGGINLILFLASQTLGGSLITLIGWTFGLALQVAVCVVCLSVAWVGWRLAQEARVQAALQHGRGSAYATAARTVHGLFGLLNIGLLVAFLAAFVSGSSRGALPGGSGLPDVGNLLKPLMELHKEQNKLLEGLK